MMARLSERRTKARIFLVDDHAVLRSGLTELINQERDMAVTGESSSAEEALQAIPSADPHLVIVDLSLQGTSGLELVKDLSERYPSLPVLVLSMHDEALYAERALRAGARGYIMKDRAITEVRAAIRRVLEGKIYLSEKMSDRLLQTMARSKTPPGQSPLENLSDRELEVFEMIGRGLATSRIAKALHLSVKTVETHRAHLKEKLNLKDATELMQKAVHWVHRV